jgi:hypothetical protein
MKQRYIFIILMNIREMNQIHLVLTQKHLSAGRENP